MPYSFRSGMPALDAFPAALWSRLRAREARGARVETRDSGPNAGYPPLRRAIAGYWTHSGYLNWDTGLGFKRWHKRKKVALAQHARLRTAQEGARA